MLGCRFSKSDSSAQAFKLVAASGALEQPALLFIYLINQSLITNSVSLSPGAGGGKGSERQRLCQAGNRLTGSLPSHQAVVIKTPSLLQKVIVCFFTALSKAQLHMLRSVLDWVFIFPWGKTCRLSVVQWEIVIWSFSTLCESYELVCRNHSHHKNKKEGSHSSAASTEGGLEGWNNSSRSPPPLPSHPTTPTHTPALHSARETFVLLLCAFD